LAQAGHLERTVFVYTSDHGEMAGDHGRFGKTCFYESGARVPLVVAGPGVEGGLDSRALVEILDLGATLCDLCGVETHDGDQGRSLTSLLRGETGTHRETVYAEMGCDKMVCNGRHKLMWGDPGSDRRQLGRLHLDKPVDVPASPPRLYDLERDPHELNDLSRQPEHGALLRDMMARLLARWNENTQARPNKDRGPYRPLR
jgi:choline-sulfatase